jgi:heterodisulfide reductase subunit A
VETLTAGIFLAGTAQAPKDIPETVSQASAAASKGMEMLSRDVLERDPSTAHVNEAACAGCFECLAVCPYGAIERKQLLDAQGELQREVAAPNPAMCEGCGLCTVTCRGGYIDLEGYSDEQVFAQLGALGPSPEVFGR